jgi:hypothetical protein
MSANTDPKPHETTAITADSPKYILAYKDASGVLRVVDGSKGLDENMTSVLGEHYLRKFAGSAWEAAWKTLATMVPAGGTVRVAIALTGGKILLKSVGSAGNYIIGGDYSVADGIKKGLITNAFTPSNYAPLLGNHAVFGNTALGSTFQSYYNTVNSITAAPGKLNLHIGSIHLHGTVYPLSPGLQTEAKLTGGKAYYAIKGKQSTSHDNEVHAENYEYLMSERKDMKKRFLADGTLNLEERLELIENSNKLKERGELESAEYMLKKTIPEFVDNLKDFVGITDALEANEKAEKYFSARADVYMNQVQVPIVQPNTYTGFTSMNPYAGGLSAEGQNASLKAGFAKLAAGTLWFSRQVQSAPYAITKWASESLSEVPGSINRFLNQGENIVTGFFMTNTAQREYWDAKDAEAKENEKKFFNDLKLKHPNLQVIINNQKIGKSTQIQQPVEKPSLARLIKEDQKNKTKTANDTKSISKKDANSIISFVKKVKTEEQKNNTTPKGVGRTQKASSGKNVGGTK